MKQLYTTGLCAAAVLAFNMGAFAQATSTQSSTTTAGQQKAGEQPLTVTGCIQKEADYRKAHDAGRGGVAGTGIGAGNEFVLVSASIGPATGATGTSGSAAAPTGTSGTTASGTAAYELTGSGEGDASKFVGQRVEISGTLKAAEVGASGRPTGGPTAGSPPNGVDVGGKDLQLRELDVTSIRQVAGNCPAQ